MSYKTSPTECVVRLVPLRRLHAMQLAQCSALRAEAGRCWAELVAAHQASREQGGWLSVRELEHLVAGRYALHSQTLQALAQKLDANLRTTQALCQQQHATAGTTGQQQMTRYPYTTPQYQTVAWKDLALRLRHGKLALSNGQGRVPLVLGLPDEYHTADIRKAELTWRADHYELCLTIDTGQSLPPLRTDEAAREHGGNGESGEGGEGGGENGEVAGVDLGEVHIAAITTTRRQALVLSGRHLRACKQGRNRTHSLLQEKISRCQQGSRRWRRLTTRKAQGSAKLYRQQRDILHQAARKAVDFCQAEGVTRIVVGDVRDIQTGVNLGHRTNQKISQWPHGQFLAYLTEKARRLGIRVEQIDESLSTRTCSASRHVLASSPRGRRFVCPGCGAHLHRDVNGSNNICSKAAYGRYGQVQADTVKYLRPIVVVPRHRPK